MVYTLYRAHGLIGLETTAPPTGYLRYELVFSCTVVIIVYLQGQRRCLMPKPGEKAMGKEQKSNKETKKAPAMTAKEKKAAKKAKKNERGRIGE